MAKRIPPGLRGVMNLGPAMAADLRLLGFTSIEQLKGRNPQKLYDDLCKKTRTMHDVCVLDTFHSIVDQAEGRPAKPWWMYSRKRLADAAPTPKPGRRAKTATKVAR